MNDNTQGWHVDPSDDCDQPRVLDWHGRVVAVLPDGSEHASLIAAVHDLLDACKSLVFWHAKRGPNDELLPASEQEAEIADAMEAIAKAEPS